MGFKNCARSALQIHPRFVPDCMSSNSKGIQLALDNLSKLNVLCHESLLEGFAEIAQSALDRKLKFLKYFLSTLHVLVEKIVYNSGSLKQSLLLYPNVTKVYF
jgi:hypothetical protein